MSRTLVVRSNSVDPSQQDAGLHFPRCVSVSLLVTAAAGLIIKYDVHDDRHEQKEV
jgi:hypothetical protein